MDLFSDTQAKAKIAFGEAGLHPDLTIDWALLPGLASPERYQCLEKLVRKQAFRIDIDADHARHQLFQHWFYSQRNMERLKADRPLGFGYPMALVQHEGQVISAPLLIWPLQIEPGTERPTQWWLSYLPEYDCRVNYLLVNWLKQNKGWDIEPELSALLEHPEGLSASIPAFCTALADRLCLDNAGSSITLMNCPNPDSLQNMANPGAIVWSGHLAWYPYAEAPGSTFDFSALPKRSLKEFSHPFGAVALDPWQSTAAELFHKKGIVLVDGHAGTGKTHLLLHFLTNALLNGHRCLIVSPSIPALKRIQDQLLALGFEKWQFLLRDEVSDKPVLLETLKALAKTEVIIPESDDAAFRQALDKAARNKKKLDERFRVLRKPVFGDNSWTETVGMYLAATRREGKELLSNQLNAQDFSFDYEEFRALKQAVESCYPLFQKINTLNHPLKNLNAGIFIHQTKQEGLNFIQNSLDVFLAKSQQLQLLGIAGLNEYGDRLTDHCERYFSDVMDDVDRIKDSIRDQTNKYGETFLAAGQGSMRLRSLFSPRQKEMLAAFQDITEQYQQLKQAFSANNYIDFTLPENASAGQVKEVVDALEVALRQWRAALPAYIQDELQRLNANNVNPRIEFQDKIEKLEFQLDALIDEINESGLYQLPLENKMLTIPKRQKFLEDVIDQMETSRLNLRDFDAFYEWQRHWFRLPETARRIVRALAKVKPPDWVGALESWYLHNCLTRAYETALPVNDLDLKPGLAATRQIREQALSQILKKWSVQRDAALKAARRKEKSYYENLFGKRNTELSAEVKLKDVFEKGFEDITQVIPIWLASPQQAAQTLLAGGQSTFDVVLIEDGQEMSQELFSKLAPQSGHIAVFSTLKPGGIEGALPAKLKASGIPEARLEICHKWAPGDLSSLADNKMEWDEDALGSFSVVFEQVDGRFEAKTSTNEAEAQRVLQLLNEIHPTPQRTFPSVGIVCLNEQQRDLISQYLFQIKQKRLPGAEKIQQLERNGLGVYAPEELAGLRFDILILSGTWGITDLRGSLPPALDSFLAQGSFHTLMSRSLQKVFVLNSIPTALLDQWQYHSAEPGKYLLANYYAYIQALANADAQAQDIIVQRLRNLFTSTLPILISSSFSVEVAQTLAAYLEPGRMQLDQPLGNWRFPLLVQPGPAQQRPVLLQPDAYFSKATQTDLVWEYEQREKLSAAGVDFLPLWSAAWWKASQQEARKTAGALIKLEG